MIQSIAAQVSFVNGQAVFQLESIRLHAAIHERLLERLSEGVRLHKTFDEVKANLDPLPKGELICHVTGMHWICTQSGMGHGPYGSLRTCLCKLLMGEHMLPTLLRLTHSLIAAVVCKQLSPAGAWSCWQV